MNMKEEYKKEALIQANQFILTLITTQLWNKSDELKQCKRSTFNNHEKKELLENLTLEHQAKESKELFLENRG